MPDAAATSIPWWFALIPGLIGGGAAGVFIKAWFDYSKDKLQPVNYQINRLTLFDGMLPSSSIKASVTLTTNGTETRIDNLHYLKIGIFNSGKSDIPAFAFHATTSADYELVSVDLHQPDAAHKSEVTIAPTPTSRLKDVEITLRPLNRQDSYTVSLYAIANRLHSDQEALTLSTSHPVKFIPLRDTKQSIDEFRESFLGQAVALVVPKFSQLLDIVKISFPFR
jgi:hypothetical protein